MAGSESSPLSLDSADYGTASLEALLKFEDELSSASLTADSIGVAFTKVEVWVHRFASVHKNVRSCI